MTRINDWRDLYETAGQRARSLYDGLDEDAANRRPEPGRWSANECVAHLTRSMETYLSCMEPAVERAERRGKTGAEPYRNGTLIGRFILRAMRGGTAKMKVKAPGVFRPAEGPHASSATLEEFLATKDRMLALLARADGVALGDVKHGTPVSRFVRVSLAQSFEIHALHNHRHLDQAERAAGRE